ncbi:MAG: Phosphate transport system permease protein PstC [Candidatus Jettenia ecosi]|uniref:Phosphate transport system permease protein PstC n=1 Tax=Candidatus Jettenia ecosi TaxID=2494326 RepID=A0A533QIN7_9BACT|nr:MAG: Phosphate transport system permease protein PstC [Candidatus Jettenia ecosi]
MKKRRLIDKAARWLITLGGAATIFAVLALFVFLFIEVYPLLRGAKVLKEKTFSLNGKIISLGVDEYQEIAYTVSHDGTIEFISLSDGSIVNTYLIAGLKNSTITSVDKDENRLVLGTNDGRILKVLITFSESFDNEKKVIIPEVSEKEPVQIDDQKRTLRNITSRSDDSATVTVVSTEDGRLLLKSTEDVSTLFDGEKKEIKRDITDLVKRYQPNGLHEPHNSILYSSGLGNGTDITSLALDHFMENLYVGTSSGEIFHINISDKENPSLQEKVRVSDKAVTTLGFLFGDISLVVGDYRGGVNIWMQVRDETSPSGWMLKKIHTLKSHNAPVIAFAPSLRDKGFVTSAANGTIYLNHATSEQNVLIFKVPATPAALTFSPKADGILAASSNNNLFQWIISNPHPEITLKTLFGKVWYEGYEKPEFVWQSTGGTDDFEPKLSLVPLIFGTIKGTVYSMIIAVPIGIFAALYTSQFLHKSLKIIKPVIELMAALPSVILGFLAGLWLAPLIERVFPAIVIMPLFIILSIALALYLWRCLPSWIKGKYRYGAEALFLIPFIIGAIYVSIQLNGVSESVLFGGDYRQWLLHILGLNYDQRNALIVGFAMGFAVIPLIFTISEDAMSNVPNNLTSASLALGATTWHTAVRVVLPTASPGIFSAVMIGFGRAVGETMIVLMATGNTPIMGWNLFNGFRALAANIAVEMPEAPVGGTLYRVLFLAALLLFVTTFIVNTFAETVRQKMKRRYSKL